jgi:predicted nuclease of restriction endonuclease-like (RecB) superfamily
MEENRVIAMNDAPLVPENYIDIHEGIVKLLGTARAASVRTVNALMTATYWEIGRRIVDSEQAGQQRAEYGEALIRRLASDLTPRFGRGFGWRNLMQMRAFFVAWPSSKILQTPSAISIALPELATKFPLPWSAYVRLLSVKNPEARIFYEAEALRAGWSVRQLDRQISSLFYERIALSKNKAAMLEKAETAEPSDVVTPEETIKDPFVLEFLDLKDEYSESDMEESLIEHLTDFLLELGDDFTFLGRQRRLRIDDTWFRIDLVFFHRRLRCLLIVDLKVGKFSYADAGQMHLYLNYAREHWMKPGENPPIGLILCAEKGAAEAHYALDNLPNKVLAAEFQTVLPNEKLIAEELERSRQKLERRRLTSTYDK